MQDKDIKKQSAAYVSETIAISFNLNIHCNFN